MAGEEQNRQEEVGPQGDDAEMMARLEEEIRRLPVAEHLVYIMHSLSALAAGRLGLTPDSAEMKDPAQARLAIDAFKALCGVLEPVRSPQEMAAHRGMLAQLQLAYAAAASAAPAPAPAEAPSAPEAEAPPAAETPREASDEAEPAADAAVAPDGAHAKATAKAAAKAAPKPKAAPKTGSKPRKPRKTAPKDSE